MKKYRIAWITFNAFMDTDIYIVKELANYYDIDWHIIRSENDKFEYLDELSELKEKKNLALNFHICGKRLRRPKCILYFGNMLSNIKKTSPDLIYSSLAGAPFFIPVFRWFMNPQKIVLAIHNVHVPKGGSASYFFKAYNRYAITRFKNFQTFSKSQYNELKKIAPRKKIFYIPFIMKDYGKSLKKRECKKITFLNFGNIRTYKRIDVLIEAAQKAYEKTNKEFRVIIAGKCDNWNEYQKLIKYPNLFDIRIGHVENNEIPDLFQECDYFVAPYQDIAQSGSSIIALNYDKPIIASRLPAFQEYIEDGLTGFLINPANIDSLTNIIELIINDHAKIYPRMIKAIQLNKKQEFSTKKIIRKYRDCFDEIIKL